MILASSAGKSHATTQPNKPQPPLKDERVELRVSISEQTRADIKKLSVKMFGRDDPQALVRFALQELINLRLYIQAPEQTKEFPT